MHTVKTRGYRYQHSISCSKCPIFRTFAFFSVSIYKLDLKLPWTVSPWYQQHANMYRSPYLQMVAELWQNAVKHASQQGTTPHNTHREGSDRIVLFGFLPDGNGRSCGLHPFGCGNSLVLNREDSGVGLHLRLRSFVPHELACYTMNDGGSYWRSLLKYSESSIQMQWKGLGKLFLRRFSFPWIASSFLLSLDCPRRITTTTTRDTRLKVSATFRHCGYCRDGEVRFVKDGGL